MGEKGAFKVAQLVKNLPECRRPGFNPWVGMIPWRRERLPTPVFWSGAFSPWGRKESDTTEWLHFPVHFQVWCTLHCAEQKKWFSLRLLGVPIFMDLFYFTYLFVKFFSLPFHNGRKFRDSSMVKLHLRGKFSSHWTVPFRLCKLKSRWQLSGSQKYVKQQDSRR